MANEVQLTFGDKLVDQLTTVQKALPADFNQTRFVQNALSVLNGNPMLQKCSRTSLMEGLLKGAYLGLDFSMKECYLIPYGSEATFQTDYKGEIKFTKKYSKQPIKDIYAKVVRKGDDFEEKIIDGHPSIDFKPIPFNDEDVVGVFAICLFENGSMIYETMSIREVNAVRNNYSKQAQGNAWKKSFEEMAKKVVLRRLCKHIDTDFESVEMHNAWEEASGMEFTNNASSVDHTQIEQPNFNNANAETVIDVDAKVVDIPDVENFK